MAEIAGRNARALRQNAGATLEDLAQAARSYGLHWSTGSVGSFESGRTVGVNLENLLAVAAALGDVIGHPITVADLFAGKGDVAINDKLTVPLARLRTILSGEVVIPPSVKLAGATFEAVGTVRYSVNPALYQRVWRDLREGDERICKSLGVEPHVGAAAMAKLWRRTFVAERDRRAGPGANAQKRGRVSRQLKAELQEVL
jgi:transcriptional regulator with XRE-family HTH domain